MIKCISFKSLLIFIITAFLFSLTFSAEGDISVGDDTLDISENPEVNVLEVSYSPTDVNDCLCGREYYSEDSKEHSKYDCIKCGKNMYACTCNCWCGSSSVLDTSGIYGSISPRLCTGCRKPCPDCDCRDDKAEVLAAEKLRLNGEVSPLNIPKPENGWVLFFAFFTMLLFTCAAVFLPNASFMKKKNSVSDDDINIADVFKVHEDAEGPQKAQRAYETPEDKTSEIKKDTVKVSNVEHYGISVSEKINLPWITSGKRMILVNESMAKVIVNDNEVICGDYISINELSQQLMSDSSEQPKRTARFPEFFGESPDETESEEEGSEQ